MKVYIILQHYTITMRRVHVSFPVPQAKRPKSTIFFNRPTASSL